MNPLIAVLSFLLLAQPALSEEVPTGSRLVRLVCKAYTTSGLEITDFVLVVEQVSSMALNTETALSETIDGSVLVDPDHEVPFTDEAAARMRIYRTTLPPGTGAESRFVEDLLAGEASPGWDDHLMDFTGIVFRSVNSLIFRSAVDDAGPYYYLKEAEVDMRDFKGFLDTNLGASQLWGDGFYACEAPALLPETVPARATEIPARVVMPVQRALAGLGYRPGAADGVMGRRTRSAIMDWQRAKGHDPTGGLSRKQAAELLYEHIQRQHRQAQ